MPHEVQNLFLIMLMTKEVTNLLNKQNLLKNPVIIMMELKAIIATTDCRRAT